ncbi:MAG: hypothetical protein JSV23_03320 [Promethearchaeota archaeon]|nr:MAG: hypothetical protein JSV23_03320 [Candidatus Lokiarchaeota archaeon]
MIQGILTFQFKINQKETGEIEPEFEPIQLIFREGKYDEDNFSELLIENDIFSLFYQHTTGLFGVKYSYSNSYEGRLKGTPYQVISYFKQVADGTQYLAISIFELDDEIAIFEGLIREMGNRLDSIFDKLTRARNSKQLSLIENINIRLKNEIKFTIFQVDRLSNLDKLQKVALIYNSDERLKILENLREYPISKKDMKSILEKMTSTVNVDILLQPFLELNILRRDWIKGEKDKKTGEISHQGEYLFLIKDIMLVRVPNENLLNHFKETKNELLPIYRQKVIDFFTNYDPYIQPLTETKKLASILLNPDVYDFFVLMRHNHYPMDKIPKIFSEFAVTEILLDDLKNLNIITEVTDENNRKWICLLTDIKPLIVFPEFLLPKIRAAYKNQDMDGGITYEIAKKALSLLEITYLEEIKF